MDVLDWIVLAYTLLYNVVIIILYILYFPDVDYTTLGTWSTVLTHLSAVAPIYIVKSKSTFLFWFLICTAVSSTLYHMAQVGWWVESYKRPNGWYIDVDDPWRRMDHAFSIASIFLISLTIWYTQIPKLFFIFGLIFCMTLSAAFINVNWVFGLREWISFIIIAADIVVLIYYTVRKKDCENKNIGLLWLGMGVFTTAGVWYLLPTTRTWDWYIHSAWHVNVFTSVYIFIKAENKDIRILRDDFKIIHHNC